MGKAQVKREVTERITWRFVPRLRRKSRRKIRRKRLELLGLREWGFDYAQKPLRNGLRVVECIHRINPDAVNTAKEI